MNIKYFLPKIGNKEGGILLPLQVNIALELLAIVKKKMCKNGNRNSWTIPIYRWDNTCIENKYYGLNEIAMRNYQYFSKFIWYKISIKQDLNCIFTS